MLKLILAVALLAGLGAQTQAPASRYAERQTWDYRTRPGDEGSMLKIQRIEPWPGAPAGENRLVYHISLIGVRFGPRRTPTELQHLPVSQASLDASVTRLNDTMAHFPEPDEGIAAWREARGGVFTIPVAEIVDVVEQAMGQPR